MKHENRVDLSGQIAFRSKINVYLRSWLKRTIDVTGAVAIAILLSPIIVPVAIFLFFQKGPVLFSHRRVGQYGVEFDCIKFRTMAVDAEEKLKTILESDPELKKKWEREQKLVDDPRVTPIGVFLRKTSLDEVPQLFNVLRGEMSLVGPRPIVQSELQKYGRSEERYKRCKPGITGIWQVSGRSNTTYNKRVAMDRYYSSKANVLLDVAILIKTVHVVILRRGAY